MSPPAQGISLRRYDGIGTSGRNGSMVPFGAINAVGGDTADPLLSWDLRPQIPLPAVECCVIRHEPIEPGRASGSL